MTKPFIKWVGGKTQLLDELSKRLPQHIENYYEPFVGGGSLFFHLATNDKFKRAFVSDVNDDLINCYKVVRDRVDELIIDLSTHVYDREYFYSIRNLDRNESFKDLDDVSRASRFIFLNRTGFNGLMRYNKRGEFNTPFGRYKDPKICDEVTLRYDSELLKRNVEISCESFESISDKLKDFKRGDFVYFDPPYDPVSDTSSFTNYSKSGFSKNNQQELRDVCEKLNARGVKWMLSNSYSSFVFNLYDKFKIDIVTARRNVNSNKEKRGEVYEVIITNYY